LHLNGLILQDYWEYSLADIAAFNKAFFEAIELDEEVPQSPDVPLGAFDMAKLDTAETMHTSCNELRVCGTTFYKDPNMSDEAVHCGVFDRNTLRTTWKGSKAWMTADKGGMAQSYSMFRITPASPINTHPQSSCTVS